MKKLLFYAFAGAWTISYIVFHIYYAYIAFTTMKLWFALVVTFIPVFGDMLFIGATLYDRNFTPLIMLIIVGLFCVLSSIFAELVDKS